MSAARSLCWRLPISACLLSSLALAETQTGSNDSKIKVTVTASRVETELSQVTSSISLVTAQQIKDSGAVTVADALKLVPGLDVVGGGPLGTNVAVFLRGANSEHTLVLIDGVELNDPISPTRAFNFADLLVSDIERIEILRGPQSTLYGSDALGGVISIITKSGTKEPKLTFGFEGGSYDTFTENVSARGTLQKFAYSLGVTHLGSGGVSSAAFSDGNKEHDGYENLSFNSKFNLELAETTSASLVAHYVNSDAELDNQGGAGADDLNRKLDREQYSSRVELKTTALNPQMENILGASFAYQSFDDKNQPDLIGGSDVLDSTYKSKLIKFDLQNNIHLSEQVSLVLGAETQEEKGNSDYFSDGFFGPFTNDFSEKSARTNSAFSQILLGKDAGLLAVAGLRVDHHSQFGSEVSWKISPAYIFESSGTKIRSEVGTGFKAPSLFQLYSSYGNQDLNPEKSLGVDFGVDQTFLQDRLKLGVTYFWNNFKDLISFDPNTFISENIAKARTQGIESSVEYAINSNLALRLAHTYTKTEDRETGEELLRRPKNKLTAGLQLKPNQNSTIDLSLITTGKRIDNDFSNFPATRTELGSYTTLNLTGSYRLNKNVELFARATNLFDKDYQEVLGYGEEGLAVYGGVRVDL